MTGRVYSCVRPFTIHWKLLLLNYGFGLLYGTVWMQNGLG